MTEKTEQINCAVVIPALNPEPELVGYVGELLEKGIPAVLVINDGSGAKYAPIFEELRGMRGVTVLTHEENRGKGAALKTAFAWFLKEPPAAAFAGLVTADADGQHLVQDVLRVARRTQKVEHTIVLGVRNLRLPNVPRRSKIGNRLTSFGYHALYGANLEDTQTGLRGFPRELFAWCMDVGGERFEYEMNVLIRAVREKISFEQLEIQTVYYNDNKGSHLRTFRDSWRVFRILIKGLGMYTLSSALSAVTDVLVFWLSYRFFFSKLPDATCYLASTVLARVISSILNYILNRVYVFRSEKGHMETMIRYYVLWMGQMAASYLGLLGLQAIFHIEAVFLKAIVDILLSIGSYQIQLRWVFRSSEED